MNSWKMYPSMHIHIRKIEFAHGTATWTKFHIYNNYNSRNVYTSFLSHYTCSYSSECRRRPSSDACCPVSTELSESAPAEEPVADSLEDVVGSVDGDSMGVAVEWVPTFCKACEASMSTSSSSSSLNSSSSDSKSLISSISAGVRLLAVEGSNPF